MFNIKNKTITIVGAKRSGKALVHLAHHAGAIVKITDSCDESNIDEDFLNWIKTNDIALETSNHSKDFIQSSDLLVISPGVAQSSEVIQWANEENIPVLGEIEFAYQFCDKPIIAVTGSNGKTTVVTLITEVFIAGGYNPRLCGNVGYPFSEQVLTLDTIDYVVLEISSFQLESMLLPNHPLRQTSSNDELHIKGFKPHITVFLNFSQNHLDRHEDLQEYFAAKKNIFMNQQKENFAVLNFQDIKIKSLEEELNAQVVFFNEPKENGEKPRENINQLAVLKVAEILGIQREICTKAFDQFAGVEHRMELVRTIDGVDFINDSKATTTEASRWALKQIDQPIIMICGGKDKQLDFTVLNELIQNKVKKIFAIGEAKEKITESFKDVVEVEECDVLKNAIERAQQSAVIGDCVMLSPMCASFDMFADYEERGRVFKQIVGQLE